MEEQLYDIKGYEGRYAVTKTGEVWSYPKKRGYGTSKLVKLTNVKFSNGYYFVSLSKSEIDKRKKYSVHRLIAETFIPNPENKPCVNHKDSNRLNNNIDNLEWCTAKENINHGHNAGRYVNAIKENREKGKFRIDDLYNIKKLLKSGFSHKKISEKYGVCRQTISDIISGKLYWYLGVFKNGQ